MSSHFAQGFPCCKASISLCVFIGMCLCIQACIGIYEVYLCLHCVSSRPRSRLKLETRLKFRSLFSKNTGSVQHVRAPMHIHRHIHTHIRRMQTFSHWPNSESKDGGCIWCMFVTCLYQLMSLSAHVSISGGSAECLPRASALGSCVHVLPLTNTGSSRSLLN